MTQLKRGCRVKCIQCELIVKYIYNTIYFPQLAFWSEQMECEFIMVNDTIKKKVRSRMKGGSGIPVQKKNDHVVKKNK